MPLPPKQSGFTVLELMIVVTIVAVLAAIGLPSFRDSIRSNRLATASNEMIATVAFARSESIKNNLGAAICPSPDGESCSGTWAGGWLVWSDLNADGLRQSAGEPVLRRQAALRDIVSSGSNAAIRFSPRGAVTGGVGAVVLDSVPCPAGQPFRRSVNVLAGGMARVQRQNCP